MNIFTASRSVKSLSILALILILGIKSYALNVTYYVNATTGNDANNGTSTATPWASITRANTQNLGPGDKLLFNSDGAWHNGKISLDINDAPGTPANPIIIASYGTNPRATIYGDGGGGLLSAIGGVKIQNLEFYGARMYGSANNGVGIEFSKTGTVAYSPYIFIDNVKMEGFGSQGISLVTNNYDASTAKGYSDITIQNSTVNNCGNTGINVWAYSWPANQTYSDGLTVHSNVLINNCRVSNNAGTASITNYSTGNGILVSSATTVMINNCIADKNGLNNGHLGAGIAGIWYFNVKDGIIQNCEAFGNYASKETDGNGFGIDGGCANCIIQYCYSHDNEGGGYGLFQYAEAINPHINNTIRYNISQNDGRKNGIGAICMWGAGDTRKLENCDIYNNTIYLDANNLVPITISAFGTTANGTNTLLPSGVRALWDKIIGLRFFNNIFYLDGANANLPFVNALDYVGTGINIPPSKIWFLNNLYYKGNNPNFRWGSTYTSQASWFSGTSQENYNGTNYGITSNPNLMAPGTGGTLAGAITGTAPANVPLGIDLASLSAYRISASNDLALNLTGNTPFAIGLNIGTRDYYGNLLNGGAPYDVGANEYVGNLPVNLLSFNARKTSAGTSLNWKTTTEIDNSEFIIEKSTDGKSYITLTTIKGKGTGTSAISQDYTFVDVNPVLGVNYYRLIQKDINGTVKLIGIVSVNYANLTEINSQAISIYPNPVQKVLSVNTPKALRQTIVLNIFDMMGKSVGQHKFDANQSISVDVAALKSGAYFLRISDIKTGELLIIKKFIKE